MSFGLPLLVLDLCDLKKNNPMIILNGSPLFITGLTWCVNALFPAWLVKLSLVSLQPWKNFLIFLNGQYVVKNIVGLLIWAET